MGDRPVTALWGIGERTAQRLADMGIHTVVELARSDHHELAKRFGPAIGPHLRVLGLGGDESPWWTSPTCARSRSREETFARDLTTRAEIEGQVARLAVEVTEAVVAEGRRVTHVAVKVRTADLLHTHEDQQAPRAHDRSGRGRPARSRRARPVRAHRPVRLLGVRVMLEMH